MNSDERDDLWHQMQLEQATVHYRLRASAEIATAIIKLQTPLLKRLSMGCPASLSFATYKRSGKHILTKGLIVQDIESNPVVIVGGARRTADVQAIASLLRNGHGSVMFFDELCRNVGAGRLVLDVSSLQGLPIEAVGESYVGEFCSDIDSALDDFQFRLDAALKTQEGAPPLWLRTVPMQIVDFREKQIFAIGMHGPQRFKLSSSDEGGGLEQSTWQLLEGVYGQDLHRSPHLIETKGARELIDVLAVDREGACLFETKALAVLDKESARPLERQAKNVAKDIKKATKQLVGAIKATRSGRIVKTARGVIIDVSLGGDLCSHAVVLISALDFDLDWVHVRELLVEAFKQTGACFHVLDLHELRTMMAVASTPEQVREILQQRFVCLLDAKDAKFRLRLPPSRE